MTPRPIILVDYDPRWPALFEHERAHLSGLLGKDALSIEHMGSTAVPGLAAKPVVDIGIAVASTEPVAGWLA